MPREPNLSRPRNLPYIARTSHEDASMTSSSSPRHAPAAPHFRPRRLGRGRRRARRARAAGDGRAEDAAAGRAYCVQVPIGSFAYRPVTRVRDLLITGMHARRGIRISELPRRPVRRAAGGEGRTWGEPPSRGSTGPIGRCASCRSRAKGTRRWATGPSAGLCRASSRRCCCRHKARLPIARRRRRAMACRSRAAWTSRVRASPVQRRAPCRAPWPRGLPRAPAR